jgi:hypothetical protein
MINSFVNLYLQPKQQYHFLIWISNYYNDCSDLIIYFRKKRNQIIPLTKEKFKKFKK